MCHNNHLSLLRPQSCEAMGEEESRGVLILGRACGEGGVKRRVKSHLEARDGAELHEQHLEFQLHLMGPKHSGTQL